MTLPQSGSPKGKRPQAAQQSVHPSAPAKIPVSPHYRFLQSIKGATR
jgi:hypothetical protein